MTFPITEMRLELRGSDGRTLTARLDIDPQLMQAILKDSQPIVFSDAVYRLCDAITKREASFWALNES